jgi:hypothetical protein
MSLGMAERIRMIIDTEEEIRLAVKLAATKAGMKVSDFVNAILREHLGPEIKDARKYLPAHPKRGDDGAD